MSERVKKSIFKKWWFWAIIVLLIIIIANSGNGGNDSNSETASTTPKTDTTTKKAPAKKAAPKKETTVGIGQPLKVGKVVFTVTGKSTATNIGGQFGKKAQGEFLVINVKVKNEGDEAITTDSSFFELKSGGKTYKADGEAAIYANGDNNFLLQDVNPGIENKGKVVFDLPKGMKNLKLQVQTGFFGTETGIIDLK